MNEVTEQEPSKKVSLRKQLGRVLLCIGLVIIVVSILLTSQVSALPQTTSDGVPDMGLGIGLVLTIFGLIAALFPEGHGEDWYWIAKMAHYPR